MCSLAMKPMKITIYGDYWDCQIYRGRLYLWTFDNRLLVYKWDEFIDSLVENTSQKLPLTCAFSRGDYLYDFSFKLMFEDPEFKDLLLAKFNMSHNRKLEFSEKSMCKFLFGEQDNPFKELIIDSDIYKNMLYIIKDDGLWISTAHRSDKKRPVSSRPQHIWDCSLLSLKTSKDRIVLSGGCEGLYEYDIPYDFDYEIHNNLKRVDRYITQISDQHSSFANWAFSSIYNSSDIGGSFLAAYNWEDADEEDKNEYYRSLGYHLNKRLNFKKMISEQEIFKSNNRCGLSWGTNEKIYRVNKNNSIDIVNYTQRFIGHDDEPEAFSDVKNITLDQWKGEVLSGGTAHFGTIIECENALVVMLSDGSFFNIKGKITKWRVYPKSIRYENHLHAILNDRIEIYSFNNDYFIDQKTKDFGIAYNAAKRVIGL